MDIDIYQQCPCHGEKKIKFCCGKGIIGDLNEVLAKNRSGQSAAALDQIERVMKKDGPKDCLLTIQTHILISTGEIAKAKEVNSKFLEANPGHSTGLHHKALICLAENDIEAAVEVLQDAMDAITGNEIPISLANAFRMVGIALMNIGNPFAAKAHLRYAFALKGESDPELQRALYELYRSPNTPLVLKQSFALSPPVEGVEWEKKYRNVHRALDRGQFRKALQFLNRIDEIEPDNPMIVRGIAIVQGFLGRTEDMTESLGRYSRLDGVPTPAAVEAEAIRQVFDDKNAPKSMSIIRTTYPLSETDGANEIALSNNRLVATEAIPVDPFEEGPPPKSAFAVLDREKIASAEELTIENAPLVIGEVLLYGKQTDRPARLEAVSVDDGRSKQIDELIKNEFDQFLDGDTEEKELGETNVLAELFEWNWHLPPGVTKKQHDDLVKARREEILLNQWTQVEFPMLGGKSPETAAKDPANELSLQAMLMLLENAAQGQFFDDELTDRLREKLGLKKLETIEYSDDDPVHSPVLQQLIDFKKISNDGLIHVRDEAMQIGNLRVLRHVVPEILSRDDIEVPKHFSYSMMSQLAEDDEQALDYCQKAREAAIEAGQSEGLYLVHEFETRLSRGLTEDLPELLQKIQLNHLDEPEVEYRLVRVLDRFGIGPEQGPIRKSAPPQSEQATQNAIWTPDQGEPAPQADDAEASGEESKLWIPD